MPLFDADANLQGVRARIRHREKLDKRGMRICGDRVEIVGSGNHIVVAGRGALVTGNNNLIQGNGVTVAGNNNRLVGDQGVVYGNNNVVYADRFDDRPGNAHNTRGPRPLPPPPAPSLIRELVDVGDDDNDDEEEEEDSPLRAPPVSPIVGPPRGVPPRPALIPHPADEGRDEAPQEWLCDVVPDLFCVVCQENKVKVVFSECRHMCTCVRCAGTLLAGRTVDQDVPCPKCRRPIREAKEVLW